MVEGPTTVSIAAMNSIFHATSNSPQEIAVDPEPTLFGRMCMCM
jgi:hypothetical protein